MQSSPGGRRAWARNLADGERQDGAHDVATLSAAVRSARTRARARAVAPAT